MARPTLRVGRHILTWSRCRRGERSLLKDVLTAPWIAAGHESCAVVFAAETLVPEHYNEVANRRITHVDKTLSAVHERLSKGNCLLARPLA